MSLSLQAWWMRMVAKGDVLGVFIFASIYDA